MPSVNVGEDIYDEVSDEVRVSVTYLLRIRDKIGIEDSAKLEGSKGKWKSNNKTIIKYSLEVYRVWSALYPQEHDDFIEMTKEELQYERSVQDSIKAGGYSPTSFPMRLANLYQILLPEIKIQDKRFWKPLFSFIPELKRSNYA